jgi:hypothetical protein
MVRRPWVHTPQDNIEDIAAMTTCDLKPICWEYAPMITTVALRIATQSQY